jgi:hypothetical protein
MYSKPFDALKMAFRLQDPHTEENENICSPKTTSSTWMLLATKPARSDSGGKGNLLFPELVIEQ